MSEWQPIETAPKDATRVDLWLVSDRNPAGFRKADAYRCYGGGKWPDVWLADGSRYVNFSRFHNPDDDYEEYVQPGNTAHPKAISWVKATHWMPLPPPPEPQGERK